MKKTSFLLLLPFSFLILAGCGKGPKPVADFVMNPEIILARDTVSFTDMSTDALTWLWNFGDDSLSTEQNPLHTYRNAGEYTVTLIATGESKSNEISKTLTVLPSVTGRWTSSLTIYEGFNGIMNVVQAHDGSLSGNIQLMSGSTFYKLTASSNITGTAFVAEALINGATYQFRGTVNDKFDYISGALFIEGDHLSNWYAIKSRL